MRQNEVDLRLKFNRLAQEALAIVKAAAPYKTGALRASFQLDITGDEFTIWTDISYMRYTTEAWLPDFAKGRMNPHQGWFEEAAQFITDYIESRLYDLWNLLDYNQSQALFSTI